jgi:hypothetical protein
VIKPGCGGVPTFTFPKKLQLTLALMAFSALLFTLACLVRLCLRARTATRSVVPTDDELDHELDEIAHEDPLADTDDVPQIEGRPAVKRLQSQRAHRRSTLWKGLSPYQRRVMERSAQLSAVWLDFKHRLCHSLLILLSIFYLRVTTLLFEALVCDRMPNPTAPADSDATVTESLFLREDGQTACWTGEHVSVATGSIILLILYSTGFPLFCFVLLTRAFTHENSTGLIGWLRRRVSWLRDSRHHSAARAAMQQSDATARPSSPSSGGWLQAGAVEKKNAKTAYAPSDSHAGQLLQAAKLQRRREDAYGFLFLSFRPACFFGCVYVLLLSCSVAAVNVFVSTNTPLLQFFLYGLLWSLQLISIALYLPYDSLKRNVQNVLVDFSTMVHAAIFLGVQQGGVSSGYMVALLVLFALILAVLLFREKLAVNVQWLHVLRRVDMKKQEGEIVEAAIELEHQLRGVSPSAVRPSLSRKVSEASVASASHHLHATSPSVNEQEGEAQHVDAPSVAATAPPFSHEMAAAAQPNHSAVRLHPNPQVNDGEGDPPATAPSSPPTAINVSLGPGQLFVARAVPASASTVELAPLRHIHPSSTQGDVPAPTSARQSLPVGALPPLRLARIQPPSPAPSVDLDRVLDEHERNQLEATHAHERERQQQLQRARKLKEGRRQQKAAAVCEE